MRVECKKKKEILNKPEALGAYCAIPEKNGTSAEIQTIVSNLRPQWPIRYSRLLHSRDVNFRASFHFARSARVRNIREIKLKNT